MTGTSQEGWRRQSAGQPVRPYEITVEPDEAP
jgi:hypothetical protein